MSYVILISGIAAAIHFSMALVCLAFASAPGWRAYRVFAAFAILLGIYAVNDAVILHGHEITPLTEAAATVNVAIATFVTALFLVFNRHRKNQTLTQLDRILFAFLSFIFVLCLIPGVAVDGVQPTIIPSFNLHYLTPTTTIVGDLALTSNLLIALLITSRYIRAARGGNKGDKISAIGFTFFVVLATEELLVSIEVLMLPYLADLGFAGLTLSFAVEMSDRVSSDSRALSVLNRSLEEQVQARSQDLAETQEALLAAERHAALGQLAGGVGHEINNPLAYVSGNLSFLREHRGGHKWDEDELEAIDEALDGVQRISRIVSGLTVFSGNENEAKDVADVQSAIHSAIRIAKSKYSSDVKFCIENISCTNVELDESKLTQVLVNLLVNAAQASRSASNAIVTTRCTTDEGHQIIEVIDNGAGIEAKDLHRVFDPLYTTKEVGQGTGLGLFICRGIVEDAGGSTVVHSNTSDGTIVRVRLPATQEPSTTLTTRLPEPSQHTEELVEGLRIYVIDDETMITRALQRMLKNAEVIVENDSRTALQHLRQEPKYDVIICDLMMPQVTGMKLYDSLQESNSRLCERFLFMTGGGVTNEAEEFLERPSIQHLLKPLRPGLLRAAINEISQQHQK